MALSLIRAEGETISVHRLVQELTRERLGEQGRGVWFGAAIRAVNAVVPEEAYDVRTWNVGGRWVGHALAVTDRSQAVALGLESDKQALYLDLIETALGDAARKAFQMLPQNYQFQGPSYRLGRTEGRTEGKADSVLVVLEARGIAVADEQRRQILECDDLERLGVWLRKAATVADASELFEA